MRRRVGPVLVFLAAAVILSSQLVGAAPTAVKDPASGVSMAVPGDWKAVRRFGATSAFVSPDEHASVSVSVVSRTSNDLDGVYSDFMRAAPSSYQGFQLIRAERKSLNKKAALVITFDFQMEYRFRQQHLKIPRPNGFVDVVFSTFAEDWARYEPVFRMMQSSMEFSF